MEKRLPVNLGDNLSHKKQRLEVKCKGGNSSDFDCKLKYKLDSEKLNKEENLKCEEDEKKQLDSKKQLDKEDSEEDQEERGRGEDWFSCLHDVGNMSQGFEVGYYPLVDPLSDCGFPIVYRIYDSSDPDEDLIGHDILLYLSKLAICFYNIKEDTDFRDVEVLMAMRSASRDFIYYITFQAFSPHGEAVTFQTKICDFLPHPYPKFEIMFVRIKSSESDQKKSKNSQEGQSSGFDHKGKIYEQRLSQVIKTYTTDSRYNVALYLPQYALVSYNFHTDSRYNVALYLSQYALVSYNFHTLKVPDAVHDIQSLKVVEPMKPVADGTTYLITFEASLRYKSKNVETFETEICIPTLFPTTTIELKSVRIKPQLTTYEYRSTYMRAFLGVYEHAFSF